MSADTVLSPDEYAYSWQMALRIADGTRDRTQQTERGQVGISDLGTCREKVRRVIVGAEPTNVTDSAAAIVGTMIHEGTLAARAGVFPHLLIEQTVNVTLPNGAVVPGHADEIDPDEPSVTDLKTVDGLAYIKKNGSSEQQRWQRHLYYQGAVQAGLVPENGVVRNIWVDRSGKSSELYVEQEPFDPQVVVEASAWLDDVLYAVAHGEEASRDKELTYCQSYCPFFNDCRGAVLAPAQVAKDPELILAAQNAKLAREEIKRWTEIKESAEAVTKGFDGLAGDVLVKQITVNGKNGSYTRQEFRAAS